MNEKAVGQLSATTQPFASRVLDKLDRLLAVTLRTTDALNGFQYRMTNESCPVPCASDKVKDSPGFVKAIEESLAELENALTNLEGEVNRLDRIG